MRNSKYVLETVGKGFEMEEKTTEDGLYMKNHQNNYYTYIKNNCNTVCVMYVNVVKIILIEIH